MSFIRVAFWLPRSCLRSPMPFRQYDLHGEVYDRFCAEQIAVIVLLASDEECLHKTGCHLRALYLQAGFQVLYLPIPDFAVPTKADLEQAVQQTIAYAQAGHHVAIHCSAGIGRMGLFTAYLNSVRLNFCMVVELSDTSGQYARSIPFPWPSH
jgi:Polymorphic toxin system, DSP-PTPase phosphatase